MSEEIIMTPRVALLLTCLPLLGCPPEYEPAAQARVLTTDPLLDAGAIAVGDRATVGLELRSVGAAPITVTDITVAHEGDSEPFVLLDWAEPDGKLVLSRGTEASPTLAVVQLSYRPEDAGTHRALLTVHSNDTQVEDGQWHVALRGLAMHPCASVSPSFVDFGPRASGSFSSDTLSLVNCGQVELTVAGFDLGASSTYSVQTPDPIYVQPGTTSHVTVAWVPADGEPDAAVVELLSNDPEHALLVDLQGNDCDASLHPDWDDDGDGWFACAGDCDDTDALVSPSAVELANGHDDDCDGEIDEAANPTSDDHDEDGWSEDEGDCHDADPEIHPDAQELADRIDNDCDGAIDEGTTRYDDDGDGYSELEGDCDDNEDGVYPGAHESISGVDDDCDGHVDEGSTSFDDDGDGWSEEAGDCDDDNPWVLPDTVEDCDELDNDCDGEIDEDDACAYLAERTIDTGLGQPTGCSSAPAGRGAGLLLALLGLLGITRRDLPWPM